MDIGDQFSLEHLLFKERVCRSCGDKKDLISEFYLTRKTKKGHPSAYAYECKECTKERIRRNRLKNNKGKKKDKIYSDYPDW